MRRRDFVGTSGASLLAGALPALAQQPGRTYRMGVLGSGRVHNFVVGFPALLGEMQKAGFIEGRNLNVVLRHVSGEPRSTFNDAKALVVEGVDLIVVLGLEIAIKAALAARAAGPIVVIANQIDIVERGYAKSLSKPGGSITGVNTQRTPLAAKQLELLAEAFPKRKKIGILYDDVSAEQLRVLDAVARDIGLTIVSEALQRKPYDWSGAFGRLVSAGVESILVLSSTNFTNDKQIIADLALKHSLPSMFIFPLYVDAGGLMSYSFDSVAIYRRLGYFASRVLAGTPPSELPIEQPLQFHLTLNLKTAKALGVELPTSILIRADRVIE